MRKLIIASLLVAMTSTFGSVIASADPASTKQQTTTTSSNPLDANARMRDKSAYGSPAAGRMRTGMRHRSRMMTRHHGMMMGHRMGRSRDASAYGTPMSKRIH